MIFSDVKECRSGKVKANVPCLYDFQSESPQNGSKPTLKPKTRLKKTNSKETKGQTKMITSKKQVKPKSKRQQMLAEVKTPKPMLQPCDSMQIVRGRRHLKNMKPIAQPNLDDISPIVCHQEKKTERTGKTKPKSRELRSSLRNVDSPCVSFIESQTDDNDKNDSGLFVSPRKTLPRFSSGKTSTPASLPLKARKKVENKTGTKIVGKTSTPVEKTTQKKYTKLKSKTLEPSIIQRADTPTSDYGSMESFDVPSPTPVKKGRQKRSHSPAFTLDDDFGKFLYVLTCCLFI